MEGVPLNLDLVTGLTASHLHTIMYIAFLRDRHRSPDTDSNRSDQCFGGTKCFYLVASVLSVLENHLIWSAHLKLDTVSRPNCRSLKVAGRQHDRFFKSPNLFCIINIKLSRKFGQVLMFKAAKMAGNQVRYWCLRPQKWPEIKSMSMILMAFLDIWIAINCENKQPCVSKVVRLHLWCSRDHKRVLEMG